MNWGEVEVARKTEVLRLTKEEANAISVLREQGVDKLINEIDMVLSTHVGYSMESLKALRDSLRCKKLILLDTLVEDGVITREDADLLLKVFEEGKNIAIVGNTATGKTTLLRSLLASYKGSENIFVLDKIKDVVLTDFCKEKNIRYINAESMNVKELLGSALQFNVGKLVISEVYDTGDILTLVTALMYKIPVVFTFATNIDLKDALSVKCGFVKQTVLDAINNSEFVTVRCHYSDDRKYKVEIMKPC